MKAIKNALLQNLNKIIRGKEDILELIITSLFSNGHILLEDVPGVGKTTLAKALAMSIEGNFNRIQFTPDLLPSDIVGGMIYNPKSGEFSFRPGPIFCHILLADEINRASPRTQSALLEGMSEQQVSIEGNSHLLSEPFMVIATQNPAEYHGTYPLPEAQLDRFAMQLKLGYPDLEEEMHIILDQKISHPLTQIKPVANIQDIVKISKIIKDINIDNSVIHYIATIVQATRDEPRLKLGASPRASLMLYRTAQSLAFIRDRNYVIPDDIKKLAVPILSHRVSLDNKSSYAGIQRSTIINEIIDTINVPV